MHENNAANYYEVLGVEHRSPREVITAAYRRLAMRWHPDRHQDAKQKVAAERIFKSIQEAYATLSDDTKRRRYDTLRGFGADRPQPGSDESVAERWRRHEAEAQRQHAEAQRRADAERQRQADAERASAEAERRRRASLPRGRDIKKKVTIPLDQAVMGGSIQVNVKTIVMCEACQGKVKGRGACGACKGKRKRSEVQTIKLRTPAGVVQGSVLTAEGKGAASTKGGLPGDLILTVAVKAPANWSVKAADLHGPLKIGFATALAGGVATVTLPTGKTLQVKIPARTNSGTKVRLSGQGLYSKATNAIGDVVLLVSIVLPTSKRRILPETVALLRDLEG